MLNVLIRVLGGVTHDEFDNVVRDNAAQSERITELLDNLSEFDSIGIKIVADKTKNGRTFFKIIRRSSGKSLANSTQRFETPEEARAVVGTAIGGSGFVKALIDEKSFEDLEDAPLF